MPVGMTSDCLYKCVIDSFIQMINSKMDWFRSETIVSFRSVNWFV